MTKEKIKMGSNRTGIEMSPIDSEKLIEFVADSPPDIINNRQTLTEVRRDYIAHSDPIGSIPMPATIKGIAKTLLKKLTGKDIEMFIDKLGERLAYERSGIRLYEALLDKLAALPDIDESELETLAQFQQEEAEHFELLHQAITDLGGDPTAQTPCADISAVASSGILKVITDPRTNAAQSLEALLMIELTDNVAWELLIDLADKMKLPELVESFQHALAQETNHLKFVKKMVMKNVLLN